jgi:meiotic recombination protein SPO11
VQDAIEQVMVEVAEMILQGQGCGYLLSTRGTVYVEELNRIVLKDKATFASFSNASTTRKVPHPTIPLNPLTEYEFSC